MAWWSQSRPLKDWVHLPKVTLRKMPNIEKWPETMRWYWYQFRRPKLEVLVRRWYLCWNVPCNWPSWAWNMNGRHYTSWELLCRISFDWIQNMWVGVWSQWWKGQSWWRRRQIRPKNCVARVAIPKQCLMIVKPNGKPKLEIIKTISFWKRKVPISLDFWDFPLH